MLQRLLNIHSDEEVIDPDTGEPYRRITGFVGNNFIEVHEDLENNRVGKYSARANRDPMTANSRMDEGGLISWFKRTFGG